MRVLFLSFILVFCLNAATTSKFKVEGMHCPLCTTAVKKAIKKLEGIQKVSAKLNTKEVIVTYEENVKIEDILKAIKTTSYEGILIEKNIKE